MERYTQFRDRGSGISPFLPVPSPDNATYLLVRVFLFCMRLPFLLSISITYFLFLQWLPLGVLLRKAVLWAILGIPGIWWVDLQIDGVRRGSLGQNLSRLPQGGTVIAATSTSPLDALYLGAVFDGVFTISYPGTRLVQQTSLLGAIFAAFSSPSKQPPQGAQLQSIGEILERYPVRPIVVFPECTTTNGRGILRLAPSLLSVPAGTKVFPVSLKYSAADITTPIPDSYIKFIWDLLSAPTHSLRVRIGEALRAPKEQAAIDGTAGDSDHVEAASVRLRSSQADEVALDEQKLLDVIGEHLARLGRAKYLGLGAEEKVEFLKVWQGRRR